MNEWKVGNDHKKDFMIDLHKSYVVELGFKLGKFAGIYVSQIS